jgi:uncharacterized membrane protein
MDTSSTVAPAQSRSGALNAALLAGVVLVAAIFAFSSIYPSDWYAVFKTVHVLTAVVWVGGGVLLTILAVLADRRDDPQEMATIARQAVFVGEKIFAPSGLVVFLMGIAMMLNTDWGWGKFWVVAGLVGYAATFINGVAVLAPMARKVSKLLAEQGPDSPETQAAIARILLIARVDVAVLLLVVADMITKPFAA